ncbi:MAG: hypothetical protein KIT14_10245 [bacterium]|nr:hypothetical protein [bacterium]
MRTAHARAAALARARRDAPGAAVLLARAALGFAGHQQRAHVTFEPEVVELLEEALAALPGAERALRAWLGARLAYALYAHPGSAERRQVLCADALGLVRDDDEAAVLRSVLSDARWALWGVQPPAERRRLGERLAVLAARTGDRELAIVETGWRFVDALELGDAHADDAFAEYAARAQELGRPWYAWYVARFGALRALAEGRLDDAERLAGEGLAAAQALPHPDGGIVFGTLLLALRAAQGRAGEVAPALQATIASYPSLPLLRWVAAWLVAVQGRTEAARAALDDLAARDFADLPSGYTRLPAAAHAAMLCAAVGDAARAAQLEAILAPYAGRCVVVGFGVVCLGAVDHHRGLLALAAGAPARARALLEQGLAVHRRLRAHALVLESELALATARAALGEATGDELGRIARRAAGLGLAGIAARASFGASVAAPAAAGAAIFVRRGDYWHVGFGATGTPLKHVLGFTYIAHLLRHPDRDVAALELVAQDKAAPNGGAVDAGDAGVLLDDQAIAAYRRRRREVAAELDEAEARHDLGHVERLRGELAVLEDELARALTLSGRSRRGGSASERARVSVAKRIHAALRRIAAADAALGRYLDATLRTGATCSYRPDPGRVVRWTL